MQILDRLLEAIRNEHRELREASLALQRVKSRREYGRDKELEVSRIYARCVVFSAEFLAGFFVMMVAFAMTRPFGTDVEDHKALSSVLWIIGSLLNYVFVAVTLKWFVYFVLFRLGIAAYLASLILSYSSTAVLSALALIKVSPVHTVVNVLEMTVAMILIISALSIASVTAYLAMRHPLFTATDGEQRLLSMLPSHIHGKIISVSAEDHYVKVATELGSTLVRAKFQAIVELLKESRGVVIHRSHWVALEAVERVERREHGGMVAQLSNGSEFPVAKSRAAAFRKRLPASVLK